MVSSGKFLILTICLSTITYRPLGKSAISVHSASLYGRLPLALARSERSRAPARVYPRLSAFILDYPRLSAFIRVYPYLSVFIRIYPSVPDICGLRAARRRDIEGDRNFYPRNPVLLSILSHNNLIYPGFDFWIYFDPPSGVLTTWSCLSSCNTTAAGMLQI